MPVFYLALMRAWLKLFRDGHNYITSNPKPAQSQPPQEKILLTASKPAELEGRCSSKRRASPAIEGIYYYSDFTYKIAIVRSKTKDNDFAGVMLASRTPSREPDEVKLELVQTSPTHFLTITYLRDHSAEVEDFVFADSSFNKVEWFRAGTAQSMRKATDDNIVEAPRNNSCWKPRKAARWS